MSEDGQEAIPANSQYSRVQVNKYTMSSIAKMMSGMSYGKASAIGTYVLVRTFLRLVCKHVLLCTRCAAFCAVMQGVCLISIPLSPQNKKITVI